MKKSYKKFIIILLVFSFITSSLASGYQINDQNNLLKTTDISLNETVYRAVLVGIERYPGTILPYSHEQIQGFKTTLLQGGNWQEENIHLLINYMPVKSAIRYGIQWLEDESDENDVSLFYFIGHGGKNLSNQFIHSINEPISDVEMSDWFSNVSGKIIIILDSCYSGGFINELGEKGRTIITASKENEVTYQIADLESGLFGYFLNVSFKWFTKNIEGSYLFSKIFIKLYSIKFQNIYGEDITIHPQLYDGISGKSTVIEKHGYFLNAEAFIKPFLQIYKDNKIWPQQTNINGIININEV